MLSRSLCLTLLFLSTLSRSPADSESFTVSKEESAYLIELYKELHQAPELSFKEVNTSARMAKEFRSAGFEVTENFGKLGVVGVMKNGDGPTVLMRCDMDALPVKETTGLPYASQATGTNPQGESVAVMHACGHDVHMSVGVGTARALAENKDSWSGTLIVIAQPAEEVGGGSKAMLEAGLYTKFPRPDYVIGLHVTPLAPAGKVQYVPEYMMANVDSVDITVYGVGGHGAYPNMTKDPIVLSAGIINALQTLVSREISPIDPAVVTVGSIHGGTKHNVIPDEVKLQLTIRSYADEVREKLLAGIERICTNQARALGFPEDRLPKVEVGDEYTPSLYNDPALTARAAALLKERFGEERVEEGKPVMGGEDFARYGREEPRVPIFFLRLGVIEPGLFEKGQKGEAAIPSLHSANFAPLPEPSIPMGVEAMTSIALDLFSN